MTCGFSGTSIMMVCFKFTVIVNFKWNLFFWIGLTGNSTQSALFFIVHNSKHQTGKTWADADSLFFWRANASSDRPGHDIREERTASQPSCRNSKEFICKILLLYMWYNCCTTLHQRRLERILKQQRNKLLQTKVVTVTFVDAHWTNRFLEYEWSCSLSSIKRPVWVQESRVSTFSHRKNTFVLAAFQPCSGFTLDRTSPCSLGAVLWFRKLWVHCTSQKTSFRYFKSKKKLLKDAILWDLPQLPRTFVRF